MQVPRSLIGYFLVVGLALGFCTPSARSAVAPSVNQDQAAKGITYFKPQPPYPYQARAKRQQGDCVIRVTFNAQGKVARVVFLKSTGHRELDDSSLSYIQKSWHSTPGRGSTITVRLNYRFA